MGTSSWIINVILALAGLYLIVVELGLSEKTPLLYVGIALMLPLIVKIVSKFIPK